MIISLISLFHRPRKWVAENFQQQPRGASLLLGFALLATAGNPAHLRALSFRAMPWTPTGSSNSISDGCVANSRGKTKRLRSLFCEFCL